MTVTKSDSVGPKGEKSRSDPQPPRRRRPEGGPAGNRLPATILVAGLNNAPLAGARLVLPMIALSMDIGAAMVGVMASLFTLAPMFMTVAFGRWVDRAGTLAPILASTGLILLACALFEVFPSLMSLLVMASLIGAGGMFSHVAATRAVGEIGPTSARTRNIGFLVVAYSLFQFLGPILAGTSYEQGGGRAAILSLGVLALVSLLILATPTHNFTRWSGKSHAETPGRTRELLSVQGLSTWLLTMGIFGGVQAIYPFVISLHAIESGLSAADAGVTLGAFAIGSLVSRVSVGLVTRRVRGKAIVSVALALGALAYGTLPFLHQLGTLVALSVMLGFAIGLGSPIVLALIYDTAPPARLNESIGLGMAITNFLQTVLPLSLGLLASSLGVGAMIWALALVMLTGAVLTGRGMAK